MATGTEVAVTKLMWALGYHVPENHIAYMRREQLVLGNSAKFTPPGGKRRAMRLEDLDTLLAARRPRAGRRLSHRCQQGAARQADRPDPVRRHAAG